MSPYDERWAIAAGIVARIQRGCLNGDGSLDELSRAFGLSDRQVRRIVKDATGATPVAIAQTTRLLLAKQLLTETKLPMTRVALASGFSSLRRFNELFLSKYGMSPRRFRSGTGDTAPPSHDVRLRLAFRPPLAWDALLGFLGPRCIPGVERIHDGAYERTVSLGGATGVVQVERDADRDHLIVTATSSLAPAVLPLMARVRDLFDLHARPDVIDAHLQKDSSLRPIVKRQPGVRVPGAFDPFELAWRAVLGQQVSVRGATTLAARFAERFGEPIETSIDQLWLQSPQASAVLTASTADVASIGIPKNRAETIRSVARLCHERPDLLCPGATPDETRERLLTIRGVGPWTAEYIAMRALHWPDAFPADDLGLRKAADDRSITNLADASQSWRPWRAYAAMRLWSLNGVKRP